MGMITPQDTTLLLAIARAGSDGADWSAMLCELAARTQADSAQFWFGARVWDLVEGQPAQLPLPLAGLRPGRVYTGEELAERALGAELAGDQRALRLTASVGDAWLLLGRLRGEFRAVDSALLSSLVPHLEQAMHLATQMQRLQDEVAQATMLARRMQVGRVRFGARGDLVEQDAVARDLLARAGVVLPAKGLAGAGLVMLAPGLEMLCLSDTGYLRATGSALPAPEMIARSLGLSLPEARLARALGHGASLVQAAKALGLTIETARYYSKQIFAKTGLRGQPDLMRRLWSGALVLA